MEMGEIKLCNVAKTYGTQVAVEDFSLTIPAGKRTVLLGPSGGGKSSVLRMIAGLEEITAGQLFLGNQLANHIEPGDRGVAMVFQNYALYPHLSVWDNVAYALMNRKLSQEDIGARIQQALEVLKLNGYEKRMPRELSGGQRQRVALARALVKEAPFFLLDEPLSNLDAQLRTHARTELVKLHEWMKTTMVYVTHDQVEAMTVGQYVAVIHEGRLQQEGTPEEIYQYPANTFVASFIGNPSMNLLSGTLTGDRFLFAGGAIPLGRRVLSAMDAHQGQEMIVGIRPENVRLTTDPGISMLELPVRVERVENWGQQRILSVGMGETQMLAAVPADQVFAAENLRWRIDESKLRFFRGADGVALTLPQTMTKKQEVA